MNWNTIYITGRPGFQAEVRKKIEHSNLDYMDGYVDSTTETVDLYWLNAQTELRALKKAIGGKLIWKYRLRFCTSLETVLQLQQQSSARATEFTQEDLDLIAHMRKVA